MPAPGVGATTALDGAKTAPVPSDNAQSVDRYGFVGAPTALRGLEVRRIREKREDEVGE